MNKGVGDVCVDVGSNIKRERTTRVIVRDRLVAEEESIRDTLESIIRSVSG